MQVDGKIIAHEDYSALVGKDWADKDATNKTRTQMLR